MSRPSPLSIPGVYALTNTVSGTVYVGAAVNIRKRWEVHRCTLKKGDNRNADLQRAWDMHGPAAFRFEVLVDLSGVVKTALRDRLAEEELAALRRFLPAAYNRMIGKVPGEATRRLLSELHLAMWADPAQRERRLAGIRLRAADPEHQKRRGAALAACRNTPEAKAAASAHSRKLWGDPEHRKAQSVKRAANWQDPAYRSKQTDARKASWQDPASRARRTAALKTAWKRRKSAQPNL